MLELQLCKQHDQHKKDKIKFGPKAKASTVVLHPSATIQLARGLANPPEFGDGCYLEGKPQPKSCQHHSKGRQHPST